MSESSSPTSDGSAQIGANLPIVSGDRREAFFGLIAPLGVDLDAVNAALTRALADVAYAVNQIKLTDIFRQYPHWYNVIFTNQTDRYERLIAAGDALRKDSRRDDILALYSIARLEDYSDRAPNKAVPQNVVHIFRQIKRVEEINVYKEVFGRNIMFVSCYSSKKDRVQYLVKQMLKTERGVLGTSLESKALAIVAKDEDEREDLHGQRMVECYPHADYVLDCTSHHSLNESAQRLVQIYFGAPFISPSRDEYCSYIANAAAYRSLDLSRQVGAAIFGQDCEVISLGCNEVPRAGGGTYWSDGGLDNRDYAVGYDSNQKVRDDMVRDALVRLQDKHWLSERFSSLTPDELVTAAFDSPDRDEAPLRDAMLRDVIEYGRMVHAEMNALADAARFRRSTSGATLYCTTMPCHMCAKLIIAAGVSKVVYVQPYTKSLVEELFGDSVVVDQIKPQKDMVLFQSLKGVTPNGFRIAFRKTEKRKEGDGKAISWDTQKAKPIFLSTFAYYQPIEAKAVSQFTQAISLVEALYPAQPQLPLRRKAARPDQEPGSPKRKRSTKKSPKSSPAN